MPRKITEFLKSLLAWCAAFAVSAALAAFGYWLLPPEIGLNFRTAIAALVMLIALRWAYLLVTTPINEFIGNLHWKYAPKPPDISR